MSVPRKGKTPSLDSQRLVDLRQRLGLSQRAMASEFGVTSAAIAQWESGARLIPGPVLRLIELYSSEMDRCGPELARLEPPPSSRVSRASAGPAALAWLVARMMLPGTSENGVRHRIHGLATERYLEESRRLRGLTMKRAQLAWSVDLLLTEEERASLLSLQSSPAVMSAPQVAQAFSTEFDIPPRAAFAEWSTEPIASASIGQVHAARLRSGEHVAVKVQFPKMVEMMEADVDNLRSLGRILRVATRVQMPDVVHETLRRYFLEECDYRIEAQNQKWFREAFAHRTDVRIPRVFEQWSSRRVLTTELVNGAKLASFAATATQEERNRAGTTIWSVYYTSVLEFGVYNTDPNPGNFLFASGQVTLLDFGRVQRLSPEYVRHWHSLSRAVLARDRDGAIEALVAAGYDPRVAGFDFDPILRFLWLCCLPALRDEAFAFTPEYLKNLWNAFQSGATRLLENSTPDMVFQPLFFLGIANQLAKLRATVPCRRILLDLVYKSNEEHPTPYKASELAWLLDPV